MAGTQEQTFIPNDVYDVIKAAAEKLEGLAAYDKYAQDGNREFWDKMKKTDEECVRTLMGELDRFAKDGKLTFH